MSAKELKKKIVEIIMRKVKAIPFARAEQITDALIAAGLSFDKSHLATFQTLDTKLRIAEHRAEVYYEALWNATAYSAITPEYYIKQAERKLGGRKE